MENPNENAIKNMMTTNKSLATVLLISLNMIKKIPKKENHLTI